ncbi:MAG: class I SAM-dependent methyltransferase [Planctomycetota bacterium]
MRPCATTRESELSPAELDCLVGILRAGRLRGTHLEIGTAAGGTLWRIMTSGPAEIRPRFAVVDPMRYFPNQLDVVRENLREHGIAPDGVDFRISTSREALRAARLRKESFDFMLVDAGHKIRHVTEDLGWGDLLAAGGILALHDYSPAEPGVMLAANRFLRRNPHYHRELHVERLLVLRKTACASRPEVTASDRLRALVLTPWLQMRRNLKKRMGTKSAS